MLWLLKEYQDRHFSIAWGCPAELFDDVRETVLENFDVAEQQAGMGLGEHLRGDVA